MVGLSYFTAVDKASIIFFDQNSREGLLPLTFTRPVSSLRVGIECIEDKWKKLLEINECSWLTANYLQDLFPFKSGEDNFLINAAALPDTEVAKVVLELPIGQALYAGKELIALRYGNCEREAALKLLDQKHKGLETEDELLDRIRHPWDLFRLNDQEIKADYQRIKGGRISMPLSRTNILIGPTVDLFIEEGAEVEGATLNTKNGPIYIGKNAKVMECSAIRGPFALCENATVKMGAKIYGATTIGPHSKVGGEVSNSIIQGFSNKGHDGYLGNAVIGEWCNLGADSNNSNLKNNYALIKAWSYLNKPSYIDTGLQFCGLIMGDHSKCGINTMFNTGTVVGVSANIYGAGFPSKFIPSFCWGGVEKNYTYQFNKAMDTAERVMARRKKEMGPEERAMLQSVFEQTAPFRKWER